MHKLSLLSDTARGVELLPTFQKEGLDRVSIYREGLLEKRGLTFSREVSVFT